MNREKEVWKPIKDFNGAYEISSYGNVKSMKRYVPCYNGKRLVSERILKQYYSKKGYKKINLYLNDKATKGNIHRLVGEAFLPPPTKEQIQINHKNGIKDDNYYDNLEWCTQDDNLEHAVINNLTNPPMPVNQLDLDGNLIKKFKSLRYAEKMTRVKSGKIAATCRGNRKQAGNYKWEFVN